MSISVNYIDRVQVVFADLHVLEGGLQLWVAMKSREEKGECTVSVLTGLPHGDGDWALQDKHTSLVYEAPWTRGQS